MEPQKRFRFPSKTYRFTGRRGLTPMKTRQKRLIPQTRRQMSKNTVENGIPLRKHTDSQLHGEREKTDKSQHGKNQQREGNQGSQDHGKREDAQKQTQVESIGNKENTEESVHPGTLQTLHPMSEQSISACDTQTDKTEIEAEVLQ